MITTLSLFIVPVLMIVVLSALLVTGKWANRALGLGLLGVVGVLFGGPSAMVMVAAQADDEVPSPYSEASAVVDSNLVLAAGESSERTVSDTSDVTVSEPAETRVERGESDGDRIQLNMDSGDVESSASKSSDLPGWVLNPEKLNEEKLGHNVEWVLVESEPRARIRERDLELRKALKKETDAFIAQYIGHSAAPTVINLDENYIRRHLKSHNHVHHRIRDFGGAVGIMHESYALLRFDQGFRTMLDRRWEDAVATTRLTYTGLVGGAVLALLGVIFTYFRLDNATRGFYTGRLQFVAVTAILVLITVGVLAARWIPWM